MTAGELIEDTLDWYAQDADGNIWYFGELSKEYEDGELVSLEGSWKAGVDGAKAGILMPAAPAAKLGEVYYQEFAFCEAEDMAQVVSLGEESISVPFGIFTNNVLKTKEFIPIEPEMIEYKYYIPGIGIALEVDLETGGRTELYSFSVQ